MNIVGFILFIIIAILSVKISDLLKEYGLDNYSNCNIAKGYVILTGNFYGERWIVEFNDETGRTVLGMDDITLANSFSHKYEKPKRHSEELVYYYPKTDNGKFKINGKQIEYYIHFCNDDLYELRRHIDKRNCIIGRSMGIVFIVCAVLILLFG